MPSYVPPKKNTEYIFYIGLPAQGGNTFQSNPTIAAGDFKVSTDGGTLGNLTTLPTVTPASGKMVKITLSAAEMNGDNVTVVASDAAGSEWDDVIINIQTSATQQDDTRDVNVLQISGDATAADNLELFFDGTGYNAANSTVGTATNVTNQVTANVTAISGDSVAADNCEAFFDGTGYAGTNNVIPTVTTLTGHTPQTGDSYARLGAPVGASISADIATVDGNVDAILLDTAEIGAAGAGLTNIPWNASWDAEVQSEVEDGLIAHGLDHLVGASVADTDVADNSIIAKLVDSTAVTADFTNYDWTTDSLRALRDRGDAAWITATGFSTHTAADVWTNGTRTLTANTNLNDPTAATIADAVWDELQADHTTVNTFGLIASEIADILVDTNSLNDTKIPDTISLAAINAEVDTAFTDYDPPTKTEMDTAFTEIKGATWSSSTDTLEAIRDRGDAAWSTASSTPMLLQNTTIATLASQTSFTLTAGSADDDAYNGCVAVITDSATAEQKAVGRISDYTGSTKTVTLNADPAVFTMAAGDTIDILANALPYADEIRTELDSNSTQLAAIVADTNELQTDWTDGGRLDLIIDELTTNIDAIETDTQDIQTQIGTAGAGLTGIPWNAAWDAEVQSEVQDAIVANGLDHLVAASVAGTDITDNSIIAKLVSSSVTADWDDFVNTTDSLQALRDRGDAAWITATGFSTHTAADVRTEMDANSTQLSAIVADTNELQTDWANGGRLDLILDELTTQGDTNETKIDTIDTNVDAILADTGTDGVVIANSQVAVKKNTALANFMFVMTDDTNHTPTTGYTVTATRSIDGAAFAACANAVSEVANGVYAINLAASDLNGDVITLRFAATNADDQLITIITQA